MQNFRPFSRDDVVTINRKMISQARPSTTPSTTSSATSDVLVTRVSREVRFSRDQINSAFAMAKKNISK